MNAIGGWMCNATWLFFKNGRFTITLTTPFERLLSIEQVKVNPDMREITLIGTFKPNKIFTTDITNGSACWKNARRYASDGGTIRTDEPS